MTTAIAEEETKQEIALLPANPTELFRSGGARTFIDSIKEQMRSIVVDPSTEKGRKEIASLAYKIAKTKTALDEAGKGLTEDQRKLIDKVNEERAMIRKELDALKDEIRRPLTEYENREKARVAGHEARIAEIAALTDSLPSDSASISAIITAAKATNLDAFQEFQSRAETTLHAALHRLESAYTTAKENEELIAKEQADKLARETKEREERDARIAAEAAEKARLEAERKAAKEKAESEAAHQRAIEVERKAAEDRERKIREEAEKAKRDADAALEAERARVRWEREDEIKAAALTAEQEEKRAANAKHRKSIIAAIASDLATEAHLVDELAGAVAEALAAGKIRHITINY